MGGCSGEGQHSHGRPVDRPTLIYGIDDTNHPHTHSHMRTHRLAAAGIPAPRPVVLKSHVLVMDFLGTNGACVLGVLGI